MDRHNRKDYLPATLLADGINMLIISRTYYHPETKFGGKVIFFHLSVILFTGGSVPLHARIHPSGTRGTHSPPGADPPGPEAGTPQDQRQSHPPKRPEAGTPPGPEAGTPLQCMVGDKGNKRAVRILLECNLLVFTELFDH